MQLGACCPETPVPDNEKERVSQLLFCGTDFCNEVRAAVVSLSLVNGTVNRKVHCKFDGGHRGALVNAKHPRGRQPTLTRFAGVTPRPESAPTTSSSVVIVPEVTATVKTATSGWTVKLREAVTVTVLLASCAGRDAAGIKS